VADGRRRGGAVRDCDSTVVISVHVTVTVVIVITSVVVASFVSTKSLTGRETLMTDGTLVHLTGSNGCGCDRDGVVDYGGGLVFR